MMQMELSHRGSDQPIKRWEEDYQLVDNGGLFQEYLEMGKSSNFFFILEFRGLTLIDVETFVMIIICHFFSLFGRCSYAVWFYHDFRGCIPFGSGLCPAQ